MAESFPSRWALASSTSGRGTAGGGGNSQEVTCRSPSPYLLLRRLTLFLFIRLTQVTFIRALALLLRSGLTAAAEATTFVGEPVVYAEGDQSSSYFLQSPQRLPVTLSEFSATTARNIDNNNTNSSSMSMGGTKPGTKLTSLLLF